MRIFAILFFLSSLFPTITYAIKVQNSRLPNGLQILVVEDNRSPVVLSSIWYKVGGSYERNGITGISHALEHMMFKGTKDYGPGVLNKLVSDVGGEQNAMTGEDYTVYYQKLPADQLELSFKLESDRMKNLLLNARDFEKEIKVIQEERKMRVDDNPQGITWERFRAAAFLNSPYHHPVVGWMTDLKHLTISDLKKWYQDWYGPNNATLIVVGDVKFDRVFNLAQKYFGPINAIHIPQLKPRTEVEPIGQKTVLVHVPAKTSWLMMGFYVPTLATTPKGNQQEIYALKLAQLILSQGESARIPTMLVRDNPIAVSASASYDPYNLHGTLFTLMGVPTPNHTLNDLKKGFLQQISMLKNKLISNDEMVRVKAQLLADDVYQKDSLMQSAFRLGVPEMVGLSWRSREDFIKQISKVTPKEVQEVVKKFFVNDNLTVAQLVPKNKTNK